MQEAIAFLVHIVQLSIVALGVIVIAAAILVTLIDAWDSRHDTI